MPKRIPSVGHPHSGGFASSPPPLFPPNFDLLASYTDWRHDWTHIVSGQFSASLYSSLLFYEQSTGHAEFWETDGQGGISLLRQYDDWPNPWTLIVPGRFSNPRFLPENQQYAFTGFPAKTGLLLYDQQAGFGAFYDTDGKGGLIKLAEYNDWRTSWTHIIAGMFTDSPYSGLLFYDQANGYAEMYATDGAGGITLVQSYTDWRTTWTHIVPGEFWNDGAVTCLLDKSCPPITDLFFYEGSTRYGETYANDGQGALTLIGAQENLPAATAIVPGSFGGSTATNLLFYNKQLLTSFPNTASARVSANPIAGGTATFQELQLSPDGSVAWFSSENYTGWNRNWDVVVPGNFWMADPQDINFPDGAFTDLLFYERAQGYAEFYLHEPLNPSPVDPLAGYASVHTVCPGDVINFYVASQVGAYNIRIYRKGVQEIPMADVPTTPADPLPITRMAYRDGAGWPPVASLTIPTDWPSGLYLARVYIPSNLIPPYGEGLLTLARRLQSAVSPLDIPFVVRATNPGQSARILLVIPDTTYEAYNWWGGRSLYGYLHSGNYEWAFPQTAFFVPYAFQVSFLRPFSAVATQANKWQGYELLLIQWLERQAVRAEMCCASDLDDPDALNFLGHYKLVVTVGHSEYWSDSMKHNLQQFINGGGNAAFLGANICYWRVRFHDDPELGRSMICYKQPAFDPSSAKTTYWSQIENDLDTELTGVSYQWTNLPDNPEFQMLEPDHWIFANTGLVSNQGFGGSAVGGELDVTNATTPPGFLRLAAVYFDPSNPDSEIASMIMMTPGGTVFSVGTLNWCLGLSQDGSWNPIDQITRNVMIRLG